MSFFDQVDAITPPVSKGGFFDSADAVQPSHAELLAKHKADQNAEAATPGLLSSFGSTLANFGASAGQAIGESLPNAVSGLFGAPARPQGIMETATRVAGQMFPEVTAAAEQGVGLAKGAYQAAKAVVNPTTTPEEAGAGFGNLAVLAATPALGKTALGAVNKVAPTVVKMAEGGARRLIASELKLNKVELQFSKDPIRAVLDEKLTGNSHEDLLQNVAKRKDEILSRVEGRLAESNKTIPRNTITALLDGEVARIKDSVGITNKEALLNKIETLQSEVLQKYPEQLTLTDALDLRREIDDGIVRWTSDAVEQGANKAKYEFRSGINREIEKQAPGTKVDNRRVSELIDIESALERRVQQSERSNIVGLGDIGMGAAGEIAGHLAGAPPTAGAAIGYAARKALGSVAVKTRLAKYLHKLAPAGITPANLIAEGGGTFTPGGESITHSEGYQVSIPGYELSVPVKELDQAKLVGLMEKYGKLAKENEGNIGVWKERDNFIFDVSKKVSGLDEAMQKGKEYNQRAVWDWKAGEAIPVESAAVKMSQGTGIEGEGKWVIDPQGLEHKLTRTETHEELINNLTGERDLDLNTALDKGYVRVTQNKNLLMIDVSASHPDWIKSLQKIERQTPGDRAVLIDVEKKGVLQRQLHFDDPQDFRDWISEAKQKGYDVNQPPQGFKLSQGVKELPADTKSEGVIGYKPRIGKLVLSDEAMDRLGNIMGAKGLNGFESFSGPGRGSEAVGRKFLKDLKEKMPKEFSMIDTDKPLTVQRVGNYKEIARHEGTHRAAHEVLHEANAEGGAKNYNIRVDPRKFQNSESAAYWDTAASEKRRYNKKDIPDEIWSDLATGNTSRLGLTRLEGLQLLSDMADQLVKTYGEKGGETLMRRFAPTFKESGAPRGKLKPIRDSYPGEVDSGMLNMSQDPITWYDDAKAKIDGIAKETGIDSDKLTAVAAALSPNNKWSTNINDVKKWARAFKAGTLTENTPAGTYGLNRKKAFRILNGEAPLEVLKGPKVTAFYKALSGEDVPVIDFHMANILRGEGYKTTSQTGNVSAKQYQELADKLVSLAKEAGVPVREYQATLWEAHRTQEKRGGHHQMTIPEVTGDEVPF